MFLLHEVQYKRAGVNRYKEEHGRVQKIFGVECNGSEWWYEMGNSRQDWVIQIVYVSTSDN